ncbi:MAG: alpha/beta hydrolase [Chloroflexota bacterium]
MTTGQRSAASGTTTLPRLSELYNPANRFEVTSRDVEYRHDGTTSWQARVYQPQGPGPFPALLEVHGGAWNNGDRLQNEPLNQAVAESGIVVAAIDFRLGAEGRYPLSIADVNYATRWLKHHAGAFNATAEGIGSIGYSSGGHMNMLSAMKPADPRFASIPFDADPSLDASVSYVIMAWPVIDPLSRYRYSKGLGRDGMVENHHNYWGDEAAMTDGNPQLMLERGEEVVMPPSLLLQGADDDVLTPGMAEKFAGTYGKAGGVIELALYPGGGHGYMRDPGPNADRSVLAIKSFIARQLQALDAAR